MTRARLPPTKPHNRRQTARVPDKVQRFVEEYLVDLNGAQAAIRAGYSEESARYQARDLLARAEVCAQVTEAMAERSKRTRITVDKVLEKWWVIATADTAEICEVRRTCCRYCYGKNNHYQRTPREYEEALEEFTNKQVATKAIGSSVPAKFDPQGGIGWNSRKDPNSKCPECFGEGLMAVFFKDTR